MLQGVPLSLQTSFENGSATLTTHRLIWRDTYRQVRNPYKNLQFIIDKTCLICFHRNFILILGMGVKIAF